MVSENPFLKKMIEAGEQQVGKVVAQVVGNQAFLQAVQQSVQMALEAKGQLDRQVQATLHAMNVPTTQDIEKLNDRMDELDRTLRRLTDKVEQLSAKLETPAA